MQELRTFDPSLGFVGTELIKESGHVCAFYTFGNLMESVEWDAVVGPMLKTKEDWVHGAIAVASSLGWGRWDLLDVNAKSASFALDGHYEPSYYLASHDVSDEGMCYFAQGGLAGFMDIIYRGNIHEKPVIDRSFYERLSRRQDLYHAEEVKAREAGEQYCEFHVSY